MHAPLLNLQLTLLQLLAQLIILVFQLLLIVKLFLYFVFKHFVYADQLINLRLQPLIAFSLRVFHDADFLVQNKNSRLQPLILNFQFRLRRHQQFI